jgi:Lamin Tail Domain
MKTRAISCALALATLAGTSAIMLACGDNTIEVRPGQDSGLDAAMDAPSLDSGLDASRFDAGSNTSASPVVINEISPGDEWVELFNAGSDAVDLEGYRVADRDKVTGAPKLAESVRFPRGTVLASKAYLLVRGGGAGGDLLGSIDAGADAGDAGAQPKPCPPGGQSYCFHAAFGISNKAGETIYLLAPDQSVKGSVVYPPLGVAMGQSYARIPNGAPDAPFKPASETPGAANIQ